MKIPCQKCQIEKASAAKMIACPTCGHNVSRNAAACPECGEIINVQMQKPAGAINLHDPVHLIGVILAAVIVLGVIAAAIIKVSSLSEI